MGSGWRRNCSVCSNEKSQDAGAFGMTSESQELFLTVPTWKRAMVFMHLLRYVLEKSNMKPWNKFDVKDYKLNVRAVTRYTYLDE